MKVKIEYLMLGTIAHKYTFQNTKIRLWVKNHLKGDILNLFAGKVILSQKSVRIDLDSSMPEITHVMDATEYLQSTTQKFDTIIFDPPWNERKARELYNGKYFGKFQLIKEEIMKHLKPKGLIISAGYKIRYFGKKRNLTLSHILICDIGGDINPFFIVVEKFEQNTLDV